MPVSHTQSITTGFGRIRDQASSIRRCPVLPSIKTGVRKITSGTRRTGSTRQVTVPEGINDDDISGMTTTFCPSTDEATGLGVHDYQPTVPGLQPTTPGREPSTLPNFTDEVYTDKWQTKFKPLIGYRIDT